MTYAVARARLVTIVEETPRSSDIVAGESTKFAHLPEGGDDDDETEPRTRSFWLVAGVDGAGGIALPYTPDISGQPRLTATMTLVVHYRGERGKRADLDVQIESDARDLVRRLLMPSLMSPRTTTNIDYIDAASWSRQALPGGSMRLKIVFVLFYL